MRISIRLIRFPGERILWSNTYERHTRDILFLQTELARKVASEIGVRISPEEEKRMSIHTRTVDAQLHNLYMQGRLFVKEPGRDSIEHGIQAIQKLLERDPGQADAWAALAEGWFNLSSVYFPPLEAMPRAKAAARKALELDPESDAALAVLGRIHVFYDWDWQAAGERLQKALDLNPNSAEGWRGMGFLRMATGQPEESFQAIDRALELDPMSLWAHFQSALMLTCARRNDEAIRRARRALDWEPEFGFMRSVLGITHAEKHEFPQAIHELERAARSQRVPTTLAFLAHGYAVSGRKIDAEKIVGELVSMADHQYVCPFEVAQAFASLGRKDEAFHWMNKAVDDRADCMIWLRAEPWLDTIRSDSRYSALVRRVGFPEKPRH
jgi:tetratricopeptide (TPR) repeat protein